MSIAADIIPCAQVVERADPVRFRCAMAAPVAVRAPLFVLYALNAEVSRAPWVTQEPLIAEMRLQWWRDALEEIAEGRPVRSHEVTTPLAALLRPEQARALDGLVAARRWDVYRDAFADAAHFESYIDATAGTLMWSAACLLGARPEAEGAVRDLAYGAGVAAFLRAVPALEAAGRIPLVDGTPQGVAALAGQALARLGRPDVPRPVHPALWPALGARATLARVVRDPAAVAGDRLPAAVPPLRLGASALSGRLWL